ncbi:unnamed protein product, partial [Ectocarpus sp. 13 AM-2016]
GGLSTGSHQPRRPSGTCTASSKRALQPARRGLRERRRRLPERRRYHRPWSARRRSPDRTPTSRTSWGSPSRTAGKGRSSQRKGAQRCGTSASPSRERSRFSGELHDVPPHL